MAVATDNSGTVPNTATEPVVFLHMKLAVCLTLINPDLLRSLQGHACRGRMGVGDDQGEWRSTEAATKAVCTLIGSPATPSSFHRFNRNEPEYDNYQGKGVQL